MTASLFLHTGVVATTPAATPATTQAPGAVAATVKHMAGILWYEMLSDMNASGLSDDTLGTGGSDFQSMFLWNLAQNDFGKYDTKLNDAAVVQLGTGQSTAGTGAPDTSAGAGMIEAAGGGAPIALSAVAAFAQAQAAAQAASPAPGTAWVNAAGATGDHAAVPAQLLDRAKTYAQKLWPQISAAAQTLGVSPVGILAQSALETGWGAAAAGNNYFGIKASPGQASTARPTHEVVNGVLQAQTASFRDYASPDASVADYVDVIKAGFQSAIGQSSVAGYAQTLQDNGYATDQSYAAKIVSIAQSPMMQQVLQSLPGGTSGAAAQMSSAAAAHVSGGVAAHVSGGVAARQTSAAASE
jgi:flagellar protein FlgJ